jgi:hypothetical protein
MGGNDVEPVLSGGISAGDVVLDIRFEFPGFPGVTFLCRDDPFPLRAQTIGCAAARTARIWGGLLGRSMRTRGDPGPWWYLGLRAFRMVVKTLGYEWSPHDPCHRFASTVLSSGLPLLDVSRWLGHKSIKETADTYGKPQPGRHWPGGQGDGCGGDPAPC